MCCIAAGKSLCAKSCIIIKMLASLFGFSVMQLVHPGGNSATEGVYEIGYATKRKKIK